MRIAMPEVAFRIFRPQIFHLEGGMMKTLKALAALKNEEHPCRGNVRDYAR